MSAGEDKYVKVGFRDDEGEVETLWAVPLGANLYRVDNTPFFAYGISADDVVEARPEADGFLFFERVAHKSGHRTVRVMLAELSEIEPGPTLLADLKRLGCTYENAFHKLICVDVPPAVSLDTVAEHLTRMKLEWEYADPRYEELLSGDDGSSHGKVS
jgi:hypothetical protein